MQSVTNVKGRATRKEARKTMFGLRMPLWTAPSCLHVLSIELLLKMFVHVHQCQLMVEVTERYSQYIPNPMSIVVAPAPGPVALPSHSIPKALSLQASVVWSVWPPRLAWPLSSGRAAAAGASEAEEPPSKTRLPVTTCSSRC